MAIVLVIVELLFSLCFLFWVGVGGVFFFLVFFLGKIGVFPFWFWVFRVFSGFPLKLSVVLISFYKLSVLVFFIYEFSLIPFGAIGLLNFLGGLIVFFYETEFLVLICFFSIFSSGWLMFFLGSEIGVLYLLIYFLGLIVLACFGFGRSFFSVFGFL